MPLGIPVLALFVVYFPQVVRSKTKHRLDYLGMSALVLTVVPLLLALSWGGVQYEWVSGQVLGLLIFAACVGGSFCCHRAASAGTHHATMDLSLPHGECMPSGVFLSGFAMFGAIIFVPLFFQGVLGASATNSGSFLTPMMLA